MWAGEGMPKCPKDATGIGIVGPKPGSPGKFEENIALNG
jgi:hypothetical protein